MRTLDSHILFKTCSIGLFLVSLFFFPFIFFLLIFLFLLLFLFFIFTFVIIYNFNGLFLRIEVGLISCIHNFLTSCSFKIVLNILSNSAVEKCRLLTDHTQTCSQVMNVIILEVDSIKSNLTFIRIIKSL